MIKNKAFVYRAYPTKQQFQTIKATINGCRYVWNQALEWKNAAYAANGTILSYGDLSYGITQTKKVESWLKEADAAALQQSLRHLNMAFENFFRKKNHTGYPKFKSRKRSRWSYTTVPNGKVPSIRFEGKGIKLPKLGVVKLSMSREVPKGWKLKNACVSVERDGKVYVSCCFEYEEEKPAVCLSENKAVGLDYKSDGLYVSSEGNVCGSPKYFRKSQKRLKKEQRKLRQKTVGSKNFEKQKARIAREYRHVVNQRKDFLHKRSTEIANQYDIVCVEDLNMKAMANHKFRNGKATLDNGYGMFACMLAYKLEDRGKKLVKIGRYYPSSQMCHSCGYQNSEIKNLSIRKWKCPKCGAHHDRDINAAKNILAEGLRILRMTETA